MRLNLWPYEKSCSSNLNRTNINTADELLKAVKNCWQDCDLGIFSAAVADFRPAKPSSTKLKKGSAKDVINLIQNPDVLKWASFHRANNQKVVGFALETNNEQENALLKLAHKNLDLIVLNSTQDEGATFGGKKNKVTIFDKQGVVRDIKLQDKFEVAVKLIDSIEKLDA